MRPAAAGEGNPALDGAGPDWNAAGCWVLQSELLADQAAATRPRLRRSSESEIAGSAAHQWPRERREVHLKEKPETRRFAIRNRAQAEGQHELIAGRALHQRIPLSCRSPNDAFEVFEFYERELIEEATAAEGAPGRSGEVGHEANQRRIFDWSVEVSYSISIT